MAASWGEGFGDIQPQMGTSNLKWGHPTSNGDTQPQMGTSSLKRGHPASTGTRNAAPAPRRVQQQRLGFVYPAALAVAGVC